MGIWNGKTKAPAGQQSAPLVEEGVSSLPELPDLSDMTIIAKGLKITGDLQGEGVIQVEGAIEGQIHLKGTVEVMPTGAVKGPVEADIVHVAGSVQGDIVSRDSVRLESTGYVEGDIKTARFVIEEGGCLNGRTSMEKPKRKSESEKGSKGQKEKLQFGADYQVGEGSAPGSAT